MSLDAKYVHTNLIARDWQKLSSFYQEIFGFKPVPPERHYIGVDPERGTGIRGSELHGIHLRMPGYDDNGPTLEIYSYSFQKEGMVPVVNRPGFGHIALSVVDVIKAQDIVLQAGGKAVGEIVTLHTSIRNQGDLVLCNRSRRKYYRTSIVVKIKEINLLVIHSAADHLLKLGLSLENMNMDCFPKESSLSSEYHETSHDIISYKKSYSHKSIHSITT